jgi:opacity protein-like surface antigen
MKRLSFTALALSSFVLPQIALAQSTTSVALTGIYAAGYAGAVFLSDSDFVGATLEYDTGYAIGGKLGYRMGQIRLEGELGYRAADAEFEADSGFVLVVDADNEYSALFGSANAYYDIAELSLGGLGVTPYVGAGLGYTNVELDNDSAGSDEEDGFLFLGEAGVTINLSPNLSIVPAYRFDYTAIDVGEDDEFTAHSLLLGARFDF